MPGLLKAATSVSPLAAFDSHTTSRYIGINIDIAGSLRLFGGEEAIAQKLRKDFAAYGAQTRIAVAPTLGAAWALVRHHRATTIFVEQKDLSRALSPLPVRALRIPQHIQYELEEINVTKIGELISLSRPAILNRFGKHLLTRIDQALGVQAEVITPEEVPVPRRVAHIFEPPVTDRTALEKVTEKLLDTLLYELRGREEKVSQLLLEIRPQGFPPIIKNLSLSIPSPEKAHLWSLLNTSLEKMVFPKGGVEQVALYLIASEAMEAKQVNAAAMGAHSRTEGSRKELGRLLDTLCTQLGSDNVYELSCRASHIPEKSFSYTPLSDGTTELLSRNDSLPPPLVHSERPSLLFHPPEPVYAMALLPDKPPLKIRWNDTAYDVLTGIGPERIAPEWWGEDEVFCTRDYFTVEIENGSRLWIFRTLEDSTWFVHGIWA